MHFFFMTRPNSKFPRQLLLVINHAYLSGSKMLSISYLNELASVDLHQLNQQHEEHNRIH